MVRFTVDNRNRLIFYGNPVGYVKADTAVVDEMFRTDELNQYLSRMNLTPRWEDGIFDRLVSGEVTGEELAQSRKGCRMEKPIYRQSDLCASWSGTRRFPISVLPETHGWCVKTGRNT